MPSSDTSLRASSAKDWSAEERFVNRSIRIRKHVLKWLEANVGRDVSDIMSLAEECANQFKPFPCSSITCYRWIRQFTASNSPYRLEGSELGYRIVKRTEDMT